MNSANLPAYTQRHWAETDKSTHERIHLLEHHLAYVSGCFEALLKQPRHGFASWRLCTTSAR